MAARPAPLKRNVPTLLDWSLVEKGIESRLQFSPSREHAFQSYILENVFGVLADATDEHIVDGGLDRGIDFIFVDHETRTINIASTKVVIAFKKAVRNFPGAAIDKIISFVDDLIHRYERVLAGANPLLALKIREIAGKHDIPIVENVPLARALYATVEIDDEIPVEHYHAVAEVIGYVMKLRRAVRQQ